MSSIPEPEQLLFRTKYSGNKIVLKAAMEPFTYKYLNIDTSRGDRYLSIEEVEDMVTYMQYWLMWVKNDG